LPRWLNMAATPATRNGAILGPAIAVASDDAEMQRRIAVVLAAEPRVDALVFALDLGSPDAVAAIGAACATDDGRPVVVVTPDGADSDVRRALRAGARAVVFDDDLESTLGAAVRAATAGLVAIPSDLRGQALKPVFSHREREILTLVAEGATNKEIADRLYLAESTVKSHLSTAFTKLGVRSRAEAAALVLDPDERPIELALGANGS
jgi:two-component system NarL family response regulator